jgi:spore germination cell wall hydrolase CwlJ-like protein
MKSSNQIRSTILVILSLVLTTVFSVNTISTTVAQEVIAQQVSNNFNREVQCLAENIYYEAGNESFEGKLAVAQVTINRVNSGKFSSSICGVVNQKDNINGSLVCQFSWVCNSLRGMIRNKYQWEESLLVAKRALTSSVAHDLMYQQNALYYHANYVNPGWKLTRVGQIGNHIFYRR